MVGSIEEVRQLAELCRELKITEAEIVTASGARVRVVLHELAIKASGMAQSTHQQPRQSNLPAPPNATEEALRFGSGSR
jgi:hypothetical protein